MSLYTHAGVELDHCRRCGGNFLEPGEADAVFGSHAEPAKWRESFAAKSKGDSDLACPKDREILEAFEIEFAEKKVEVDVCNKCHGLWLDKGEGTVLYDVAATATDHAEKRESGEIKPGVGSYIFQILTGFPVEVWNPVRRTPVVVYTLLVALVVLFVGQMYVQGTAPEWALAHQGVYMMVPAEVLHGEHLWSIVTCAFFHGGFMHILGNAYFLKTFGDNVEDELGPKKFIVLYAIALLSGSLLFFAFNSDSKIPMLGASGAISGLMGAYLVLFPKTKLYVMIAVFRIRLAVIWYLAFWIGYQLLMLSAGAQGTAWLAHIGGFAAGVVGAWVFGRDEAHERPLAV